MRNYRLQRLLILVILALSGTFGSLLPAAAENQSQDKKITIYLFNGLASRGRWESEFEATLVRLLNEEITNRYILFSENLGFESNQSDSDRESMLADIRRRTAANPADLVIAVLPSANLFLRQYGDALFPDATKVHVLPNSLSIPQLRQLPNHLVIPSASPDAIRQTLRLMVGQYPLTEKLVLVSGMSDNDRAYLQTAQEVVDNESWPFEVEYWIGDTVSELQQKAASLDERGAVLFLSHEMDHNGSINNSTMIAQALAKATSRPVYTFYETILGYGLLGGILTSIESYAQATLDVCITILDPRHPDPPATQATVLYPLFDWKVARQLRLSQGDFSPGSRFINREPTLWQDYRGAVIAAAAVLAVQTILIGLLVTTIRRRRLAERTLSQSYQQLRSISSNLTTGVIYQALAEADGKHRFTYISEAIESFYGIPVDEALRDSERVYSHIHPEDLQPLFQAEQLALDQHSVLNHQCRIRSRDGNYHWAIIRATPGTTSDGQKYFDGLLVDISNQKDLEVRLQTSLREKETLIRELYHRTKNTLQVIHGLLVLQAAELPKNTVITNFVKTTEGRLEAIAWFTGFYIKDRICQ